MQIHTQAQGQLGESNQPNVHVFVQLEETGEPEGDVQTREEHVKALTRSEPTTLRLFHKGK